MIYLLPTFFFTYYSNIKAEQTSPYVAVCGNFKQNVFPFSLIFLFDLCTVCDYSLWHLVCKLPSHLDNAASVKWSFVPADVNPFCWESRKTSMCYLGCFLLPLSVCFYLSSFLSRSCPLFWTMHTHTHTLLAWHSTLECCHKIHSLHPGAAESSCPHWEAFVSSQHSLYFPFHWDIEGGIAAIGRGGGEGAMGLQTKGMEDFRTTCSLTLHKDWSRASSRMVSSLSEGSGASSLFAR